jgi:hypothetical protein
MSGPKGGGAANRVENKQKPILLDTPEIPCSISPAIRFCDESIVPVYTVVLVRAAQPVSAQPEGGSCTCSDIADARRLRG